MIRTRLSSPFALAAGLATLLAAAAMSAVPAEARERHGPLHVDVATFFPEATPGGFQEVQLGVFNSWKPHAIDVTVTGVTIDAAGVVTPFSGPFTVTLEPRHGFELVPLLFLDDSTALGTSTVLVTVDAVRTERPGKDGDKGPTFSAEAVTTYEVVE